jgi:hypothetical protein
MKFSRIFIPAGMGYLMIGAMVCALGLGAVAQEQGRAASDVSVVDGGREWVPDGVTALGQGASSRTEFRLDHWMLVLASKVQKDNPDLRRVVAGVNGVSVHSFHFAGGVVLNSAVMASIGQQYQAAGWLHLVSKHKNAGGETTDLWLRMDEAAIRDVAVLYVRAREVDFVAASGSVTPLDLLHLSGHFGIPKMDGGMAVPVPERRP